MVKEFNAAVVDFLIENARFRSENYSGIAPNDCSESVAIFDELDCLDAGEFALVYALYLLGSGSENKLGSAKQKALAAAFEPLESMASDANLHLTLIRGLEQWSQHATRS